MSIFSSPPTDYTRFDPREVIAAAPDFFAHAFGYGQPGRELHPLAHSLDMATIAHAFGATNGRPASSVSSTPAVIAQGAASAGFTRLFREATAPIVLRSYRSAIRQRPFAAVLEMDNFHPQPIFGFNIAHALDHVPESAKIPRRRAFAPDAAHGVAGVSTYSQIFELTRDDLLSNDVASLKNVLLGAGALAAQTESSLLVNAIEADPALSDGLVFDSSNTVAQALSDSSMGAAIGMLRNQGAPGHALNIAPAHLVVEPTLELLARKLIRDADMGGDVQVSALPGLSTGRWLLLGDPEQIPSLTLFTLGNSINFQVQRSFKNDGVDMSAGIDAGAGFLGRIGVVLGGA